MGFDARSRTLATATLAALVACSADAPPTPAGSASATTSAKKPLEQKFEDFIKTNTAFGEEYDRESTSAAASKVYARYSDGLRDGYAEIKDAPDAHVSEETRQALAQSIAQVTLKVCGKLSTDANEIAAFNKLCDAYEALFDARVKASGARRRASVATNRGDQLVAALKAYEAEFCACTTMKCVEDTNARHKAKLDGTGIPPSQIPAEVGQSYERIAECELKISKSQSGGR